MGITDIVGNQTVRQSAIGAIVPLAGVKKIRYWRELRAPLLITGKAALPRRRWLRDQSCSRLYGKRSATILTKLPDNVADCLQRAAECAAQAERATDLMARASFVDLAARWRRLAESYQYVDRVNRFLHRQHAA